jgi:hypothetical protein
VARNVISSRDCLRENMRIDNNLNRTRKFIASSRLQWLTSQQQDQGILFHILVAKDKIKRKVLSFSQTSGEITNWYLLSRKQELLVSEPCHHSLISMIHPKKKFHSSAALGIEPRLSPVYKRSRAPFPRDAVVHGCPFSTRINATWHRPTTRALQRLLVTYRGRATIALCHPA